MSIVEFIGFVITMLAMVLLFAKRKREKSHRRDHPGEVEEEGLPPTDPIKQFLVALQRGDDEEEEEEEEAPAPVVRRPPPPPAPKKALPNQFQSPSQLDRHHLNDRYTASVFEVHGKEEESYGAKLVGRLPSRRDMMIYHEIFSRSKGCWW